MSIPPSTSMLSWKVFVTPAVATVHDDLPPGETARMWSPISSILIYGERDAILVDTPTTTAQATALADWVEKSGKNLRTIYTTHGHGDHFFGNGILLERFPGATAVATPKVIEVMRKQMSPQVMAGLWNKRFPGLIPENIVLPEQLKGDTLSLEGYEVVVIDAGHTDIDDFDLSLRSLDWLGRRWRSGLQRRSSILRRIVDTPKTHGMDCRA